MPETTRALNATQNAMRLLKRNPPDLEGSDGTSSASEAQDIENAENGHGRFGEELAPHAEIWKMYLEEAQEHDREVFDGGQRSLDTVLWFAGLLSVTLAVFLLETNKMLLGRPTYAAGAQPRMGARLQQHIELGLPALAESIQTKAIVALDREFTHPTAARWIIRVWCIALALSSSTALLAARVKQGFTHFHLSQSQPMHNLARARQSISRIQKLKDWGALLIMDFLPTLLYVSLFLFSIGLVIYLGALDAALAAVISTVIGIMFPLFLGTRIPGKMSLSGTFVTMFRCLRKSTSESTVFGKSSRNISSESVTSSVLDLKALVWLSSRSKDLVVVERAYQAMAGLQQSVYTTPDLEHRRPNLLSYLMTPNIIPLSDLGGTIDSVIHEISQRFDGIWAGTTETDGEEPPVCRYANAMIALGHYLNLSRDASPNKKYWLDILHRIGKLWASNLPEQSLSGNSFAGMLIAEMDVLRLTSDSLQPRPTKDVSAPGNDPAINFAFTDYKNPGLLALSHSQFDKTTSDSFLTLYNHLVAWIELTLTLLQSHDNSETSIDPYLVNALFRATRDAAHHLECMYAILRSNNLTHLVSDSKASSLNCLKILIDLLLQMIDPATVSIMQLTEALKTYACIAPLTINLFKPDDKTTFDHISHVWNLDSNTPSSFIGILGACVYHMMPLLAYLSRSLTELPQHSAMFHNALHLVHLSFFPDRNTDKDGPFEALFHRIDNYIQILEQIGEDEASFELMSRRSCSLLCLLAVYRSNAGTESNGLFLPISCFRTLIHLFSRSVIAPTGVHSLMDLILRRLRTPSLSLAQLPPLSSPIPEISPSINYLQQITRHPEIFSLFVQAVSSDYSYTIPVLHIIIDITILAANHDPALVVEPIELQAPAVPGFLEALSWALPRFPNVGVPQSQYNRFIIAASTLLVVACEDLESRNQISHSWARTRLLRNLRNSKDDCVEIIGEGEWEGLVDGLILGEPDEAETESNEGSGQESDQESNHESGQESDQESVVEPVGVAVDSDIDSDSEGGTSVFDFL